MPRLERTAHGGSRPALPLRTARAPAAPCAGHDPPSLRGRAAPRASSARRQGQRATGSEGAQRAHSGALERPPAASPEGSGRCAAVRHGTWTAVRPQRAWGAPGAQREAAPPCGPAGGVGSGRHCQGADDLSQPLPTQAGRVVRRAVRPWEPPSAAVSRRTRPHRAAGSVRRALRGSTTAGRRPRPRCNPPLSARRAKLPRRRTPNGSHPLGCAQRRAATAGLLAAALQRRGACLQRRVCQPRGASSHPRSFSSCQAPLSHDGSPALRATGAFNATAAASSSPGGGGAASSPAKSPDKFDRGATLAAMDAVRCFAPALLPPGASRGAITAGALRRLLVCPHVVGRHRGATVPKLLRRAACRPPPCRAAIPAVPAARRGGGREAGARAAAAAERLGACLAAGAGWIPPGANAAFLVGAKHAAARRSDLSVWQPVSVQPVLTKGTVSRLRGEITPYTLCVKGYCRNGRGVGRKPRARPLARRYTLRHATGHGLKYRHALEPAA